MQIDVRTEKIDPITDIKFASAGVITWNDGKVADMGRYFTITECGGEDVNFYIEDIDNLILALKKAKELWGGSDGN